MAAAAVLGQERQERAHALDVDRIEDAPFVARRGGEAGALELGEMRRQGRWRNLQPLGDLAGRQADRALAHQQAEHLEPGGVGECCERLEGIYGFHMPIHFEDS
jgi:hypothetical protein